MERLKKFMLSTAVLMLGFVSVNNIYASERSSSVTVSYSPDNVYERVKLEVEVSGQGTLYDADQVIRNGIVTYEMQDEDTKSFTIKPDSGYEVTKLEYTNGYQTTDMRKDAENSNFSIKVKDKDASLIVRFDKKKSDSSDQNKPEIDNNGSLDNTSNPQTGDNTHIGLTVYVMVGALMLVLLLWKKEQEEEHK